MISIINIRGGLGNQMFCYAFALSRRCVNRGELMVFDTTEAKGQHHGYELDHVFRLNTLIRTKGYSALLKYVPDFVKDIPIYNEKEFFVYDERTFLVKGNVRFNGFWQTQKYFVNIEKKIRKSFRFRTELLNAQSRELASKMRIMSYTSLHIRRGDYSDMNWQQCSVDYYQRAIAHIQSQYPDMYFVIFSDDMEWVRTNLPVANAVYVDWNVGNDSWQDMYLMSLCNHNIIANSSFSWWGAWLNNHLNKIVIAPEYWIFDKSKDIDVLPEEWIVL